MSSVVQRLTDQGIIKPPRFLPSNMCYEVMMGSVAYGVSDDTSDVDVYGFCIPHKEMVFPHLGGEIMGFGSQKKRFEQYQQHHVMDGSKQHSYDFAIYSIVKFFQLCMDNNPNMVDSLFVPQRCVLFCTEIGNMVREKRMLFLHKGSWHKFKGYAYSQLHKMVRTPEGKSKEMVEKFGFDVKFAYHVVRLLGEVEQILTEGDLDLTRDRERLKAIRRGEWTEQQIRQFFEQKEKGLEEAYQNSSLPYKPDETAIKNLLLECLEHHYGRLDGCVVREDAALKYLMQISGIAIEALQELKV